MKPHRSGNSISSSSHQYLQAWGKGGRGEGRVELSWLKAEWIQTSQTPKQKGQRGRNKSVLDCGGGEREKEKDPESITS